MSKNDILLAVIRTLETVPVYGKVNCNKMAGCISALESLCEPLKPMEKTKEEVVPETKEEEDGR